MKLIDDSGCKTLGDVDAILKKSGSSIEYRIQEDLAELVVKHFFRISSKLGLTFFVVRQKMLETLDGPIASKIDPLLEENRLFPQNGHICKPTALANLDLFYAEQHGVENIPLRKDRSEAYNFQAKGLLSGNPGRSVREMAKVTGSVQGEVLRADQLVQLGQDMGYLVDVAELSNLAGLRQVVFSELTNHRPVLTCFAVDRWTGLPQDKYDENEHACLIVGFDAKADTVDIAHWGEVFRGIKLQDLHASMAALPETRDREIYQLSGNASPRTDHLYHKYDLVPGMHMPHIAQYRASPIPPVATGFKNKTFLLRPNLQHQRWSGGFGASAYTQLSA
ncbi:hypothetical protein BGV48_24470 [Burkholderia ubonensis]|nr:hypothetical protein BGV48_24470 [Burkholderia ubonensis]